jgi:hypothetical protein
MAPDRFSVSPRLFVLAAGATEAALLSLYLLPPGAPSTLGFIALQALLWALYGVVVWRARSDPGPASPTSLIIAAGMVFRLTLLPHSPVGSDDIYRYVWDGHIALNGINPFSYAPSDPALARFATESLPSLVNHPEMKSAYPAAAQVFFLLSNALFGTSIAGFKLLLLLVDGFTLILMHRLLKAYRLPPHLVLLYAWSPLPLFYGALDGHIDLLGIPFLLLTLLFVERERPFAAGLALAGAALVKIHPVVMAPFLYVRTRGWRWMWAVPVAPVLFAAGVLAYDEPSHGWREALGVLGSHWEFNGALFTAAYAATGNNQTAHVICAGAFLAWIGWLAVKQAPPLEKYFLGFLGFVLLGATAHPWYFLWIAALLVFRWSVPVLVLLAMTNLSNIVVYRYQATGIWSDDPLLVAVEYGIPVCIGAAMAVVRRRGAVPVRGGQ